jgi:hypothetical protein
MVYGADTARPSYPAPVQLLPRPENRHMLPSFRRKDTWVCASESHTFVNYACNGAVSCQMDARWAEWGFVGAGRGAGAGSRGGTGRGARGRGGDH